IARPGAAASVEHYERLFSIEERIGLQLNLIWTGSFNGVVDGIIGKRSLRAIRKFQTRLGRRADGILTRHQIKLLKIGASNAVRKIGGRFYRDANAAFELWLPSALLLKQDPTRTGSRYASQSGDLEIETIRLDFPHRSFQELYDHLVALPGRRVTYAVFRGDWFVVSGIENQNRFYARFQTNGRDQRGFSIAYHENLHARLSAPVIMMSNTFQPYLDLEDDQPLVKIPLPKAPEHTGSVAVRPPKTITSGTGFFITDDGVLATNAHVVDDCASVEVAGWGMATPIRIDNNNDLAVLRVETGFRTAHPLKIALGGARLGEDILALGYPLRGIVGSRDELSVTTGVVSTLSGLTGDARYLTISAPVQQGNSGGPLINRAGLVVGVVSAKLDAQQIMRITGDIPQNVNFAVKSNMLADALAMSGVEPQTGFSDVNDLHPPTAAIVAQVKPGILSLVCH
ncbi:MAG: trypsin-like peptidase domain-containing protein, partial [Cohaesibacteraceae bacterium]|nr:trypsin-like peptidase domain-containing protein [Cohaesibacteraceae bacterium]